MTKRNLGRGVFGLLALFFMGTGLILMFSPANMLGHLFIEPIETAGALSSIRALWGGTIIAVWASVLLGVVRSNIDHIYIGFFALLLVLVGRLVGYFVEGSFSELFITLIPTIIAITLWLIAYKLMVSSKET